MSSIFQVSVQYPSTTTCMSSRPNKRKMVVFRLGRDTMSSPAITQPWKQSARMLDYRDVVNLPRRPSSSIQMMLLGYGG
jgi:hypothetical protein